MTECPSLEDLALYAGRDHEPAAMTDIQAHLAACGECRIRIAELQEDRELLARRPAIPEEAFLAVREGVAGQLRNRRGVRYAAVAAAVVLAWLAPLSVRKTGPPATVQQTATVHPPPPAVQTSPRPAVKAVARRNKRIRPAPVPATDNTALFAALDDLLATEDKQPPAFSGSVVVTLQTQDPNVTIILLEESTGGAE